ncbi:major facilitator superfamily domain-containing protein 6-like [Triplophysa dalaica]|uniref:major facilitator superfamily domain-containing protein 6-like n=1 Tax=Triplophysa dalaica TaxID=1582913 RepID=UPI0024DFFC22|nr:major facilitator superfamily domain-containing protein 6-like [Triplophysa dalaica]
MLKQGAMQKNKQWNVNGAMRLAAAFHFLHSCGSGCLLPFLTLYLRHLGLTPTMTGLIMASKHLLALVWRPISSVLARQYDKRRTVIVGSLVSSALVVLILLLFPSAGLKGESGRCNASRPSASPILDRVQFTTLHISPQFNETVYSVDRTADVTERPNEDNSEYTPTPARSNTTRSVRGVRSLKKSSHQHEENPRAEFLGSLKVMDAQHQMFFLVLIVMGFWEFTAVPLEWTADDGLHDYFDFIDATDRHRGVKVWKHLGAAVGSAGVGILVTSLYCLTGTMAEFYSYSVLMLLTVPAAAFLPLYLRKRERPTRGGFKALQVVHGNSQALLGAVTVVLTGMTSSAVSDFLLWQMQDHDATEFHMGVSLALTSIAQVGFNPLNGRLVRFLKYHGWLLVLAVLSLSLQCLYYSFLWGPWAVIPAQILAGFGNGALWWSVASQCEDVATPGTEKTVLRLFEALSLELGAGLGSLTSGFVVQKFGVKVLFQGTSVILALWSLVVLTLLKWKIPRQRRINYSRLLADTSEMSESESDQEKDWMETALEGSRQNNKWRIDKP